jgi:putative ABC transport system permease protein
VTLFEAAADGLTDLRAHRLRTLLQTLGVVLGVGSLVAVQGLVDAGRRQSLAFYDEVGGLTRILIMNRPPAGTTLTARERASTGLTWEDARALARLPHVTRIDPIVSLWLPLRHGSYQRFHQVTAATPAYASIYRMRPARGRFLADDDLRRRARVCVLGDTAARRAFGNEDPVGRTLSIDGSGFRVVGVLRRKEFHFNEQDHNALEWMNGLIFIPLTSAFARFTGDPDLRVNYMNLMVDDVENNRGVAAAAAALLRRRHSGVEDFEVWNRNDRLRRQEEQGRMFDITFLITGIVSLIVGGIVIMNIMLASFQERVREVGIRKAFGARGADIAAQFLVESVLVTVLGGAAGLLLGIGCARGISALIGQPAIVTARMALVGVATSVLVGLFFGLYPAIRASRLNPVEALRYE